MPKPDPEAYHRALVASRARFNTIRREEARRILSELRRYVSFLGRRLRGEFGPVAPDTRLALERARQINEQAAQQLMGRLTSGTEQARGTLFEDTLEVWEESGLAAARSVGVDAATLGAVRPPPVTLLGAFESIGAAQNWRTLLRGHVSDAATEANAIVRASMTQGVGFDELSRRMRRYVEGSEEFDDLFQKVRTTSGEFVKLDARQVPASSRGALNRVRFNARRIAWSEMRNARHEAEIQHMLRDPLIEGVQWTLSPTHSTWDTCDLLASRDWYGMGPGVYPVHRVPAPPHPMDACSNISVGRDVSRMREPKPDPDRRMSARDADVPEDVTDNKAQRVREETDRALTEGPRRIGDVLGRAA